MLSYTVIERIGVGKLKKFFGISFLLVCFFVSSGCSPVRKVKIESAKGYVSPRKGDLRKNWIESIDGGYIFYVEGKPFLAKGVIYNPTPIGEGYDYDFFTDKNKPWLIDGKLMKEMGINCVRIYSAGEDLEKTKEFIRDMYDKFGIYTIVSDWLGLWSYPGANYADKEFREKTKKRILNIVEVLKDEKGLLMWILGNENNYTFSGKIGFWTSPEIEKISEPYKKQVKKAEIYYSFVDELAGEIKKIDKVHPVALGNGEASFLDIASGICKNIDALAIIAYRGKKFGNLFNSVKNFYDLPIFLSEFGCDSYDAYKDTEDQDVQAEYLLSQWKDLYANTIFSGNKQGSCIGGAIFEWTDEWWKHDEGYSLNWKVHNKEGGWSQGAYYYDIRTRDNLNMNEEWFGLMSLIEEKENGINKRIPRKSFYLLKKLFSSFPATLPSEHCN
ncbi:MAG: glycosyl hydrolase [Candidatus Omnitrophota bacterium]